MNQPSFLRQALALGRIGISFFWVGLIAIGLFMINACQASSANPIDIEPFILMAESASCAEQRNTLYIIDDQYVFWSSEGTCSDAGYAHILYGQTPQEKLCYLEDSFMGPVSSCETALNGLFETILANLDQADLGLGNDHSVVNIFDQE